jgi:hypothetical protein
MSLFDRSEKTKKKYRYIRKAACPVIEMVGTGTYLTAFRGTVYTGNSQ